MKFTKMHGIGNDYIYVNALAEEAADAPALARAVSDRHFGIGGDGLVLIDKSDCADFRMVMYNADGSRGKMCGNAIRCVGKYVYDHGMTDKTEIDIQTDSGVKHLALFVRNGRVERACVDMGAPVTDCEAVPCLLGRGTMLRVPIVANGRTFAITPVSMGNPHGVIFIDQPVETFDVQGYGRAIERSPFFPDRVNVEFVNVLAGGRLRMRVWERGSGETMACGTGACAVLVAARLNGLAENEADVLLLGGTLRIRWDEQSGHIFMTGPATHVFDGEMTFN